MLAQLRRDGGEFDDAIALHRRAIAIDPALPVAGTIWAIRSP
jgi:hypothetical protein